MSRARHCFLVRSHLQAAALRWPIGFILLGLASLSGCSDRAPATLSGAAADEPYAAHPAILAPARVLIAEQPAMRLSTTFAAGRVSVRVPGDDPTGAEAFELGAVGWGCVGAMRTIPSAEPHASSDHPGGVDYRHADFDEWYQTGPSGLEQGFTVRRLPECAAHGEPLRIELAFRAEDGYSSAASGVANEALLRAPGNRPIHYGKARADDASGSEFAVNILTGAALALELDASSAVLPLVIDPLAWVQQSKLSAANGAVGDSFGTAVALSGDTALIGAPGDDGAGTDAGAAYVFVRVGNTWTMQQKLQAKDGAAGDGFGTAVALSGDTSIIGAPSDDDGSTDSGSAYVFVRSAGVWTQSNKLAASDALANDHFGAAVAVSDAVALVGAPFADKSTSPDSGVAYLFQGPAWTQLAKLAPASSANDHDGAAVAISGGTLAIGSDRLNGYVVSFYQFAGGVFGSAPPSLSSTSPALGHFGSALAMSTNYTVLGARTGDPNSAGSVLVVSNADHATQFTLTADDGAAGDQFGNAVAISDSDTILIGSAKDDDKGADSGTAYAFHFATTWTQSQKLTAADGTAADGFGSALALSGNLALVGAPSFGTKAGVAYAEGFGAINGTGCAQDSDCGSGFCVEKVCCNTACNGACQSCLQKNKSAAGGADGVCGNVRANTDPLDTCPAEDVNTCGKSGLCNTQGACIVYASGTSCTLSECASSTSSILNSACNGLGACKPVATVTCQLGSVCIGGTCKSGCAKDSDCDATLGFFCTPNGECKKPKGATCGADNDCSTGACQFGLCCLANVDGTCFKPLGTECALGTECSSGTCSNGVCCGSACTGQCQSCALPATKGTCAPISGPPCSGTGGSAGAAGEAGQSGDDGQAGLGSSAGFGTGGSAGAGVGVSGGAGTSTGTGGSVGMSGGSAGLPLSEGGSSASAGATFGAGGPSGGTSTAGQPSSTGENGNAGSGALPIAGKPGARLQQDQLVTACGCRAAGGRGSTQAALSLALGLLLASARRRKQRAQR